jgi:predicted small integral membrane protein
MIVMLLRYIKIFMMLMIGLFGLIGAYYNLTQIDSTLALVSQVVTGSGATGVAQWQQIESPWLVALCFSTIPTAKIFSGLLCLFCVIQMWSARNADMSTFQQSKQVGMAGCGVMLAMLFGVFIFASETWFQQWQTELGVAILGAAERYIISVGVVAFFINLTDDPRL